MNNSREFREIVLASLLHDIGKLVYRTGREKGNHSQMGEFFYNEYIKRIKAFAGMDRVPGLISEHHNALDSQTLIISESDHLSAGERQSDEGTFTIAPLQSIFSRVSIGRGIEDDNYYYYSPAILSSTSIYPEKAESITSLKSKTDELNKQYGEILDSLKKDLELMADTSDFNSAMDTLLSVLEKNLSLVPSAGYKSIPDVSLYDHMKSTAAISACLFMAGDRERPFLLIECDVSGIQEYIYSINNIDAEKLQMSKRLRGRSFEVNLLAETLSSFILNRLGLYRINLIYSGGGNFIILAPLNEKVLLDIAEIETEINRSLYEKYAGALGAVISSVTIERESIMKFAEYSGRLKMETAVKKQKKFQALFSKDFFRPNDFNEESSDVCGICGRDFAKGSGTSCFPCRQQVTIGERMPAIGKDGGHLYIIKAISDKNFSHYNAILSFEGLGVYYFFAKDPDGVLGIAGGIAKENPDALEIILLNDTGFIYEGLAKKVPGASFSFRFSGSYVPHNLSGSIKTFEEIAGSRKSVYPLLSMARMDADNLGYIFKSGLKPQTLSRFSSLSRAMNYFFLWDINDTASAHGIYITYSGGDDLFVAGNWKDVLDFSVEIRKKFGEYTCSNRDFGLSCGIAVFKPSFPVRHGAETAGELESRSKNHVYINRESGAKCEKDSVTVFGHTVSWKRFLELYNFSERLYCFIEENPESSVEARLRIKASLIYRIYSLVHDYGDSTRYLEGEWIHELMPLIKYMLAMRNMGDSFISMDDRSGDQGEKVELVKKIIREDILRDFIIPASIIIYSARK